MIFPLPLVPFEAYMLQDDRPAYPMNFFMRLRFSGRFDRPALESALATAVARHPLLSARVQQRRRNRFDWVAADAQKPDLHWAPTPTGGGYPRCTGIPLPAQPGLRTYVLEGEAASDLLLQFHHCCCDGLGAFAFIRDLLVAYASAVGTTSNQTALAPLDEQRLRRRGAYGLTPGRLLRMLPRQLVGLSGVRQFFMHSPVTLTSSTLPGGATSLPDEYPAAYTREFDENESAKLRSVAAQCGTTVNDLLIRDLFLALGQWRSRRQEGNGRGWLRMSVPVNLRTVNDRRLPAANVVSMVFLDRRPEQFTNRRKLLQGIHDEMQLIKRLQLGLTFVFSLRAFHAVPGGLARMTKADRCTATCVLTNLGAPLAKVPLPREEGRLVAGNVVLETLDVLPPFRPRTQAAFAVFRYARRLRITMHYDPRSLAADQAEDLLATFVQHGHESARWSE